MLYKQPHFNLTDHGKFLKTMHDLFFIFIYDRLRKSAKIFVLIYCPCVNGTQCKAVGLDR